MNFPYLRTVQVKGASLLSEVCLVLNGAKLSGVEQAARLLFSVRAGSRGGCPTSQILLSAIRA